MMRFVVEEFAEQIPITEDGVNMGVIYYSNAASIVIHLDENKNTPSFQVSDFYFRSVILVSKSVIFFPGQYYYFLISDFIFMSIILFPGR